MFVLLRKSSSFTSITSISLTLLKSSSSSSIYNKTNNSNVKMISTLISGDDAVALYNSGNPNIKFIDGSWHMNKQRNPINEYNDNRIPQSMYFDIDEICDKTSLLPHMMPRAEQFSDYVTNMGINNNDNVIVYVRNGSFAAARVWWMFQVMGHKGVSIIDGGFNAWTKAKGPIESGALKKQSIQTNEKFVAKMNNNLIANCDNVLTAANTGAAQILDARSSDRFYARVPEPRAGLEGGHIPGSLNLPFNLLCKDDDVTTFKSLEEIRDAFVQSGLIFGAKSILTCGSGVSAAVLMLGLHLLGKDMESAPIYDGSWSEWGSKPELPKAK